MRKIVIIAIIIFLLAAVSGCSVSQKDSSSTMSNEPVQSSNDVNQKGSINEPPINTSEPSRNIDFTVPDVPKYEHIMRDGYVETNLVFIEDENRPEDVKLAPLLNTYAQEQLKCLYDMTGFQIGQCYVTAIGNGKNDFKTDLIYKAGQNNDSVFFATSIDNRTGRIIGMQILFKMLSDSSEETLVNLNNPTGAEIVSKELNVRWYMEHSSIIDWYPIKSIEEMKYGAMKCYMEGNGYYDVYLNDDQLLISSIY